MVGKIVVDPRILVGKPVVKGTRIPVYLILNLLGKRKKVKDILEEYPELKEEDVLAAINYS